MYSSLCFVIAVMLGGCASVQTQIPRPSKAQLQTEQDKQSKLAFETFSRQQEKLDVIASQILRANADLCSKTRFAIGLRTHSQKSYTKHLREQSERWMGADKTPSILSVLKNGPADLAGIKAGDVIVDAQGKPVTMRHKQVQTKLETDQPSITIKRGDTVAKEVEVTPDTICDYPVHLRQSGVVNAYATGKAIIFTTGMMDFVKTDTELAMILAHELAHNTHNHVRKSIQNIILSGFAKRAVRPFEAEADYVGLNYMARAGYDLQGVEAIWHRLGQRSPKNIVRAKTHPTTAHRLLSLKITRDEINEKTATGQALLPNEKTSN